MLPNRSVLALAGLSRAEGEQGNINRVLKSPPRFLLTHLYQLVSCIMMKKVASIMSAWKKV